MPTYMYSGDTEILEKNITRAAKAHYSYIIEKLRNRLKTIDTKEKSTDHKQEIKTLKMVINSLNEINK